MLARLFSAWSPLPRPGSMFCRDGFRVYRIAFWCRSVALRSSWLFAALFASSRCGIREPLRVIALPILFRFCSPPFRASVLTLLRPGFRSSLRAGDWLRRVPGFALASSGAIRSAARFASGCPACPSRVVSRCSSQPRLVLPDEHCKGVIGLPQGVHAGYYARAQNLTSRPGDRPTRQNRGVALPASLRPVSGTAPSRPDRPVPGTDGRFRSRSPVCGDPREPTLLVPVNARQVPGNGAATAWLK